MPRRSAATILYREPAGNDAGDSLELFLVSRSPALRFFAGCLSFPGGGVDGGDGKLPVHGEIGGRETMIRKGMSPGADRELVACAARELFEETGILLCRARSDGGLLPSPEARRVCREALLGRGGDTVFETFLREHSLTVDAGAFRYVTRLVTPAFIPIRHDTTFFLVETDGEPEIIEGELVGGRWYGPREALAAWNRGEISIAPPIVTLIDELSVRPLDEAVEELRSVPAEFEGSGRSIPFAPGYEILPLESPPLPPSIPSNAFLVGCRNFVVIDPSSTLERGRQHLVEAVARRIDRGDHLEAIVLTHHHPDHVGSLDALRDRFHPPVWGHPLTGKRLSMELDRELEDGDTIDLTEDPEGRPSWHLRAIFTPGHAEGHLAFHDDRYHGLIAGDLVSTLVSMYVGSPGGNLRDYIRSLEKIRELSIEVLYPSHGMPGRQVKKLIDETIGHRKARIEETFELLGEEPRDVEEIARRIYPEIGPRRKPLVVRTSRAALEYLVEEGRAREVGEDRFVREPARS